MRPREVIMSRVKRIVATGGIVTLQAGAATPVATRSMYARQRFNAGWAEDLASGDDLRLRWRPLSASRWASQVVSKASGVTLNKVGASTAGWGSCADGMILSILVGLLERSSSTRSVMPARLDPEQERNVT